MKDVVVFGAGDQAEVAYVCLSEDSPHRIAAFTVDGSHLDRRELFGLPVIAFEELERTYPPDRCDMFVAVGFKRVNRVRQELYDRCRGRGYQLISYVSSKAIRVGTVEIGDNCLILEANVLQPFVKIGNDVVMWSGNHIGHHSTIGDHVFIASHAVISGKVSIGEGCFVGVNASFRDGVKVAPHCVIGAGATILHDTDEGDVFAAPGTPRDPRKSWDLKSFQ